MKPTRLIIILILVYVTILLLASCDEPESIAPSNTKTVTFQVNANAADCLPADYVVLVIIDKDDKLNEQYTFDCRYKTGQVTTAAGDLIELRIWSSSKTFDKSLTYDIVFIQGDIQQVANDVRYTGSKYIVR